MWPACAAAGVPRGYGPHYWLLAGDRDKIVSYQGGRVIQAGGCSDPAFWEMVALDFARSGREPDLVQAIAACGEGMQQKPERTTASAWASLAQTGDLMRLRLAGGPARPRGQASPGCGRETQARAAVRVASGPPWPRLVAFVRGYSGDEDRSRRRGTAM